MKTKLDNKGQLKFSFDKPVAKSTSPNISEQNGKVVRFDPKSELYKRILSRK